MSKPLPYSQADLAQCARREVAMRERVYPRWVMVKRMTQDNADREIAMMKQIAEWLEKSALVLLILLPVTARADQLNDIARKFTDFAEKATVIATCGDKTPEWAGEVVRKLLKYQQDYMREQGANQGALNNASINLRDTTMRAARKHTSADCDDAAAFIPSLDEIKAR